MSFPPSIEELSNINKYDCMMTWHTGQMQGMAAISLKDVHQATDDVSAAILTRDRRACILMEVLLQIRSSVHALKQYKLRLCRNQKCDGDIEEHTIADDRSTGVLYIRLLSTGANFKIDEQLGEIYAADCDSDVFDA